MIEPGGIAFNGDHYFSHVHCLESDYTLSASHPKKSDSLTWLEKIIRLISTQFGIKVKHILLDEETLLHSRLEAWISTLGIVAE